jgi:hypothetical protein
MMTILQVMVLILTAAIGTGIVLTRKPVSQELLWNLSGDQLLCTLNFAITNSIGAFLVLDGIGFLYARTGALNLAQIGDALAGQPAIPLSSPHSSSS